MYYALCVSNAVVELTLSFYTQNNHSTQWAWIQHPTYPQTCTIFLSMCLGSDKKKLKQARPFLWKNGGHWSKLLIVRFHTLLFLWWAEGCLSTHYSLQWEAGTGGVERKNKETNPVELCVFINHRGTEKHFSSSEKRAHKYRRQRRT